MQTEAIIATLLAAAAFLKKPVQDVAAQSIKDIYDAAKYYLRKKFGEGSDGSKVLDLALEKPESGMRKAVLAEEAAAIGIEADADFVRLIRQLAELLPASDHPAWQEVHVAGRGNKVVVAGRDVIHTERVIRRVGFAPNERHITAEQRDAIRALIGEVAVHFARADGKPNFAVAHRMLQREFNVISYVLLQRDRFEDAVAFLKRQRAASRWRMSRSPSPGHATQLYRAVFSRASVLGWDREQVYAFATEKLGLEKPLTSLSQLGVKQVRSLFDRVSWEITCKKRREQGC
jgi:hypothetical protein